MKRRRGVPSRKVAGDAPKKGWRGAAALGVLLAVATLPIALFRINNSDVWWHIVCGREMLRTWSAPDLTRFYSTPVQPGVGDLRFTFLGDILLALIHAVGGVAGLQLLVIACVVALVLLLFHLSRASWNGWTVLLITITVWGCGQLLLVRNSLFALPLLGLLLWLVTNAQVDGRRWCLFVLPCLLGLWGVVHGSYLLGFVVLFLLLLGESVDAWRGLPGSRFLPLPWLGVLLIAFCLISLGNPMTARFLRIPWTQVSAAISKRDKPAPTPAEPLPVLTDRSPELSPEPTAVPPVSTDPVEPSYPVQVKRFLNTLIWSFGESDVQSGDFRSPFDRLRYLPVIASFALAVVAAFCGLFWIRPIRCTVWLPFAAILVHGSGYVRSVGYLAIFSAWVVLVSVRRGDWRLSVRESFARWGERSCVAVLILIVAIFGWSVRTETLGQIVGQADHVPGFGKIPAFDDAMCRFIMDNAVDEPVFTTIVTGSYALSAWHPRKAVFVDGFFSPHPRSVWSDYLAIRKQADPDRLVANYGVTLALIENSRSDWNLVFLRSKQWLPYAIGPGTTLYRYNDRGPKSQEPPRLLFSGTELAALPDPLMRHRAAAQFYNSIMSLHAKGRALPALEFRRQHADLFQTAHQFLVPWEREKVDPSGPGLGREYILTR